MEDFFRFFTERQKEVYKLREQKMTFAQIGNTLGISSNAARQHYQNALRRIREYEAYNRMVEHNNQPVDFPLTRGELKLIYMGLNELTKVKPYKVTANVRSNWEEQRSYERIIIDDFLSSKAVKLKSQQHEANTACGYWLCYSSGARPEKKSS